MAILLNLVKSGCDDDGGGGDDDDLFQMICVGPI